MQKTVCDKCGGDCGRYTARLYGTVTHKTADREYAAEDDIRPFDLCHLCFDALHALFPVIRLTTVGESKEQALREEMQRREQRRADPDTEPG